MSGTASFMTAALVAGDGVADRGGSRHQVGVAPLEAEHLQPERQAFVLDAYLFWGAEYWLLRDLRGDPSYLGAFARVLECS